MRSKLVFLYVDSSFDMSKCIFIMKKTFQNVGCVFAYFCGGHKNNFLLQFRNSFNIILTHLKPIFQPYKFNFDWFQYASLVLNTSVLSSSLLWHIYSDFEGSIDFMYYCLKLCLHVNHSFYVSLGLTDKYSLFSFFVTETTASDFHIRTLYNHIMPTKNLQRKRVTQKQSHRGVQN